MVCLQNIKHQYLQFVCLLLYCVLLFVGIYFHEPWRDEWHTLNVCEESNNLFELFNNREYTGHPFGYYVYVFIFQKIIGGYASLVIAHSILSILLMYLLLFKFNFSLRIMVLFITNYYFLFEFGIIFRSYSSVILLFVLSIVFYRIYFKNKHHLIATFLSLILACQMHIQAIPIAVIFGFFYCYHHFATTRKKTSIFYLIALLLFAFIGYYSAKVPIDGEFVVQSLMPKTNFFSILIKFNIGFFPISDYQKVYFWNEFPFYNPYLHLIISITIFIASYFIFTKKYRLLLFALYVITFYVLSITNGWAFRHYCFSFFSMFLVYLLCKSEVNNKVMKVCFFVVLFIQSIAGLCSMFIDIFNQFSDAEKLALYIKHNYNDEAIAGCQDYVLDGVVHYLQQPIYYLGAQKTQNHVVFNQSNFINPYDRKLFLNHLHSFLYQNKQGFLILSNDKTFPKFIEHLLSDNRLMFKEVYKQNAKSIVKDESFVLLKISLK